MKKFSNLKSFLISTLLVVCLVGHAMSISTYPSDRTNSETLGQSTEKEAAVAQQLSIPNTENLNENTDRFIPSLELNQQISDAYNTTKNEATSLSSSTSFAVYGVFTAVSGDYTIRYSILTEDKTAKTGTVMVGDINNTESDKNGLATYPLATEPRNLVIPSSVVSKEITYTVTTIGQRSLADLSYDSITLPNTLTTIGVRAFAYVTINKLVIPEGVTIIDNYAFNAPNFSVLKLPSSIEKMGESIFGISSMLSNQLTVYLPYDKAITSLDGASWKFPPFWAAYSASDKNQTLIITKKDNFQKLVSNASLLRASYASLIYSYEMDMEFYDMDANLLTVDKNVTKLYSQSITWQKQSDESWKNLSMEIGKLPTTGISIGDEFPTLPSKEQVKLNGASYTPNFWGIDQLGLLTVDKNGVINRSTSGGSYIETVGVLLLMSPRMVAVEEELKFTISTLTEEKVYNGFATVEIKINRGKLSDQLQKKTSELTLGLYIIDKNHALDAGTAWTNNATYFNINKSTYYLMNNVADSGDYVLWFYILDKRISSVFYLWQTQAITTANHALGFNVAIAQNPLENLLSDITLDWEDQTELPSPTDMLELIIEGSLSYSAASSFEWTPGAVPKLGTHSYQYTFTPGNFDAKKLTDKGNLKPRANNFTKSSTTASVNITYSAASALPLVTFKNFDGTILKTEEVAIGGAATSPPNPKRAGYKFTGWDNAFDNVQANLTVTAQFKIVQDEDFVPIPTLTPKPIVTPTPTPSPAPPSKGQATIEFEDTVDSHPSSVPDADLAIDAILTPQDKELVEKGDNIEIKIDVRDLKALVPENDKVGIEEEIKLKQEAIPNLTLFSYIDISLSMRINEGNWKPITVSTEEIEITLDIPLELQKIATDFYVIRNHEGVSTMLKDLDNDPTTVTIRTHQFSTYAIAYVLIDNKCELCGKCTQFLNICWFYWLALIIVASSVTFFLILIIKKKKHNKNDLNDKD